MKNELKCFICRLNVNDFIQLVKSEIITSLLITVLQQNQTILMKYLLIYLFDFTYIECFLHFIYTYITVFFYFYRL